MISSTTRAVSKSPHKKWYNSALLPSDKNTSSGPTKGPQRAVKKSPKEKPLYHRRQNDGNVLLRRLSLSSPTTGTLLERIGGSVEAEVTLPDIDRDCVSEDDKGSDIILTDLPFTHTHYHTPEPGEVERFLESVIGAAPPLPPSPSRHAFSEGQTSLAPETLDLPVENLDSVHDPSTFVRFSPPSSSVDHLSTLDHFQQSGDTTMPPPSSSTIEECRKYLVPVLALNQARDPAKRLNSEQCLRLLSDDRCKNFFRRAKEMRLQLSSLVSQKAPVNQSASGSLKRDRIDDVGPWVRNTRSRFSSVNMLASDEPRWHSDITLVDFTVGRLPPKAPRAMLLASQAPSNRSPAGAQSEAPYEAFAFAASPTTEDPLPSTTTLTKLVLKMFPALAPNGHPETMADALDAPVGMSAVDQSDYPNQAVPPAHAQPVAPDGDFVSHLPTEPGIWFRQQGRQYAEIVDINIDVSDEMFYVSAERLPIRLRMHLRLCSVPINGVTESNDSGDAPASLQDVDRVIERHELHWPKKGKLVVQVNPESEGSATWLPYNLDADPLDVTGCMRPGKNTFRFIQLSDLSGFTFVLAASPPPPEEAWRNIDWASLVENSRVRASEEVAETTADDLADLAVFAHIPVTVRPCV